MYSSLQSCSKISSYFSLLFTLLQLFNNIFTRFLMTRFFIKTPQSLIRPRTIFPASYSYLFFLWNSLEERILWNSFSLSLNCMYNCKKELIKIKHLNININILHFMNLHRIKFSHIFNCCRRECK